MVAPNVHGQSGLDGPKLPEPAFDVVPEDAVTPVSYTHLDVYKRQDCNCIMNGSALIAIE